MNDSSLARETTDWLERRAEARSSIRAQSFDVGFLAGVLMSVAFAAALRIASSL